eukprot:2227641-Rhodomonas_salina.1
MMLIRRDSADRQYRWYGKLFVLALQLGGPDAAESGTRCAILLRPRYALPGADLAYAPTGLIVIVLLGSYPPPLCLSSYALSSTDTCYAATGVWC